MEPSMPAELFWETSKIIIKQWCAVSIQQKVLLLLMVAKVDVPTLHKILNILGFPSFTWKSVLISVVLWKLNGCRQHEEWSTCLITLVLTWIEKVRQCGNQQFSSFPARISIQVLMTLNLVVLPFVSFTFYH